MFPSKSCIVLALAFGFLIHFELVFVYGVYRDSASFFHMWICSCRSTICLSSLNCLALSCLIMLAFFKSLVLFSEYFFSSILFLFFSFLWGYRCYFFLNKHDFLCRDFVLILKSLRETSAREWNKITPLVSPISSNNLTTIHEKKCLCGNFGIQPQSKSSPALPGTCQESHLFET